MHLALEGNLAESIFEIGVDNEQRIGLGFERRFDDEDSENIAEEIDFAAAFQISFPTCTALPNL